VGHIPFDTTVIQAMVQGVPVTACGGDSVVQALRPYVGAAIGRFRNVIGEKMIVMNESTEALEQAIIGQSQKVIDPETGADA
jgi:hypothetical protein